MPLYPLVPACAVIALTTATGSGACGGPAATRGPPSGGGPDIGRPGWMTTSPWLSVAWTWFKEAPSPTAKVAAAAPNAIAATIVADLRARANGWARPRVTGRGSGSRAVNRAAHWPRPGLGVRPTASTSTVRSRPARDAAAHAVAVTRASAPASTATLTHGVTPESAVP